MYSQKLLVTVGGANQSNEKIYFDFNEIPQPTAIYIPSVNQLILNNLAHKTLGMKENELFDLGTWNKSNPYFEDRIRSVSHRVNIIDQNMHIILFNSKHVIMNYSITHVPSSHHRKFCIILFSLASEKYSVASISSLYSIKEEMAKLKPYLNRTGRLMHEIIMKKHFPEGMSQSLTFNDMVYYEKELHIIQKEYPTLSYRDVILCGLLANDLECQDIAAITKRTIAAVFVTIHRINKKLKFENKKQLIASLKELVKNTEQDATSHIFTTQFKPFDDIDFIRV